MTDDNMKSKILRALLAGEDEDEPGHWQLQVSVGALTGSLRSQEFSRARTELVAAGMILFHKKRQGSLMALTDTGRAAAHALPPAAIIVPRKKRKHTTRPDYQFQKEDIKPAPSSRKCLFCGKDFEPDHYAQYIHTKCKQNDVFHGDTTWAA